MKGVIVVLVTTLVVLACGIWQATLLEQEFQSIWFLPPSTYLRQWFDANSKYFPGDGERVTVYLAEIDFPRSMEKIEKLVSTLKDSTDIIKSVDSWYPAFKEFSNNNLDSNIPDEALNNATFNADLTQFLYNADPNTLGLRSELQQRFFEDLKNLL